MTGFRRVSTRSDVDVVKADPSLTVRSMVGLTDDQFERLIRGLIGWRAQAKEHQREQNELVQRRVREQVAVAERQRQSNLEYEAAKRRGEADTPPWVT